MSGLHLLVTAYAPVPGTSPHASAVLGMAAGLNGEVDIVTIKTEALPHFEHYGNARMFRVPVGMGDANEQRRAFGRAVDRQLQAQAYDVVHVRSPIEGQAIAAQKTDLGFQFVYEVATFPDEGEGLEAEREWTEAHTTCAEAADLIIVSTAAASRSLEEHGHAGKVVVVPPGVDVNRFDWWPKGTSDVPRLLCLGSLSADRDLGTVLGAVRMLLKLQPVNVLVAGEADMELRQRARRMVDAFGLGDVVQIRGEPKAAAIPILIGAADVCIAPAAATPRFQDHGDLPQPLLEYFACRRPVVAAGVPGLSDVVRDEREALLYPPGDDATLADTIHSLLDDRKLRDRLVRAAYTRVRDIFSDGARRRRIAEVYESLMPGSQRFDAWEEGFSHEATGTIQLPPELNDEDTGEATSSDPDQTQRRPKVAAASSDEAVILFRPDHTPHTHPAPAPSADTPATGLIDQIPELSAAPTLVSQAPELDTDETHSPGSSDPDTGDVQRPD